MNIVLTPAVKIMKPLKVLLYGPTHSGKTYGSLKIAAGIVMQKNGCTEEEAYPRILFLDSEYKRGTLYAHFGKFNYMSIEPPYSVSELQDFFNKVETIPEIDVVIVDSLTHFWSKEGGILDEKAEKDKQGGNSYTNWQDYTSKFNKVLDSLLHSSKSVIVTTRSKNDTALVVNEKGKQAPVTYGLKPEMRDNIEYEFDIVFNVDKQTHSLIVDKGVPGMSMTYEPATAATGMELYDLVSANAIVQERQPLEIIKAIRDAAKVHNLVSFVQLLLSGRKLDEMERDQLLIVETAIVEEIKRKQIKPKK